MFSSSLHLASHRSRHLAVLLGLVASLALGITPPVQRFAPGPTDTEVALAAQQARADDLAAQNADLTEQLRRRRPVPVDRVAQARADDLKRQADAMAAKLRAPKPGSQEARANDLARRLGDAETKLRRPHPPVVDREAEARADDLKRQVDALTGTLAKPRPEPDPLAGVTATFTRDQIVAARAQFGMYTQQAPFDYGEVDLVQGTVGRRANIIGYFQAWTEEFRADAVKQIWKRGQIPLLTWEPQEQVGSITSDSPDFALPTIISGNHDDYIRRYARSITATGLPLILRFAHEMNGTWYPWSEGVNGNADGDYAKAWRHVHDIFTQEGANAYTIWLWSPNRINQIHHRPAPAAFYPGDDVVDWIGLSGYFREYDPAATFDNTYGSTLPLLRDAAPTKPIFLSEIGATEAGNHKVDWIHSLFAGLTANPDIIGFGWFNLTVTATVNGQRRTNDWRINSTPGSAQAVAEGLAQQQFGTAP